MKLFGGKVNTKSVSVRRLRSRLRGSVRVLLLGAVCLAVLLTSGRLTFALAVHVDGTLVGYARSREALDGAVSRLESAVSDTRGSGWSLPVTSYIALSGPEENLDGEELAQRVLAAVPQFRSLHVIYADGEAVCAYETAAEAAAALEKLADAYPVGAGGQVGFTQEVAVAPGTADEMLLEDADRRLAEALTVETRETVSVRKTIPYETREIRDSRLYEEESYVETPGEEGYDQAEYLTVCRDGQLAECVELRRVRQEPVTQVLVTGTREHRSTGSYIWPVEDGWLSSDFGLRSGFGSSDHKGVDIANDAGTPIMAADGGVVLFADTYGGYGLMLKIQHENGDVTYYAHASSLLVSEGEAVEQGQVIALMGCTGVASGNHLHFEMHPGGGEADDPMDYLPACTYRILGD